MPQTHGLTQRISAKVALVNSGKVLVLKPSEIDIQKDWHMPGGLRDDYSESIKDVGVRELKEETGVDVEASSLKLVMCGEWKAVDHGDDVLITALFFVAEIDGEIPEVTISNEHSDFAWIDSSDFDSYDLKPEAKEVIQLALNE